jgi:predicted HD phosphohydrolase
VLPDGVGKNQSKAQGVKSKNPFFQNFFYLFIYNDLTKTALPKTPKFSHQTRIFALLREGGIISKRYEKKQKFIWSA